MFLSFFSHVVPLPKGQNSESVQPIFFFFFFTFIDNEFRLILLHSRKVVFKDKGVLVVWVSVAGLVGAGVAWAEIAL